MGPNHAGWFRLPGAPKKRGTTEGTPGGTAIAASHSGHRRCDPRHLRPRPQRHQVRLRILQAGPKSQKGGEISTTNKEDRKRRQASEVAVEIIRVDGTHETACVDRVT